MRSRGRSDDGRCGCRLEAEGMTLKMLADMVADRLGACRAK
jgi:hypothetical protein